MKQFLYALSFICFLIFINCKTDPKKDLEIDSSEIVAKESALTNLPDTEAGDIVGKAIEKMGGMENWESKNTISYNKTIKFFDSIGQQLREVKQLHEYQLKPELKIKISWEEDGDKYYILNNGDEARKYKNNELMMSEEDKNSAWNSSFGSHYVATIPFKLTDEGAVLEYSGIDTLSNGKVVRGVTTTYKQGAGSAAGKHTWIYYFDKDTFEPAGNFLDYGDGYSFIINESFVEVDGIVLMNNRKSYNTNAEQELLFLTTEYTYDNYKFNQDFGEDYFEFKK